jgi:endonuclease/exonuclease/phosphatase family metal-dependent hydrolase
MTRTTTRARLAPAVLVTAGALAMTLWSPMTSQASSAAAVAVPGGLLVKSTTTTSAVLDWRKATGASGYRVRYATSSNMTGSKAVVFKYSNGTVNGLRAGTKYWFRVAAAASNGAGALQSAYTKVPYATGTTVADEPAPSNGRGYDLHVASFNISGILNDTSRNAPWADRKDKVAEQLLGANPGNQPAGAPDVMALQEANTTKKLAGGLTQYTDLVATLNAHATAPDTYAAVDPSIQSLSTRIAYNSHTLTLVRAGALKWTAQETAVDGYRYMAWAIFKVRSTGTSFFFSSNHLETASESVRRRQWQQLITAVPGLAGGLPVIFGGDFNSPRGAASGTLANPTGNVMLPKMKPAGFGDTLGVQGRGNYYVSSSRAQHVVNGSFNSVNKYNRVLAHYPNSDIIGQDVDYIFASNKLVVKDWQMVFDETKTGSDSYSLQGVIPSDHNMVRSVIVLPGS